MEEVRDDVINRLKNQIEGLKNQIDKYLQTKANMDNYYKNEINQLKSKMISLINENNKLRNEKHVIENDMMKSQQKIVDSWLQVYKEFKNCFNSINDVQNLINLFGNTNNNLLKIKDFQDEKELHKLRDDAKTKEKQIKELNEIKDREENKNKKSIQDMISLIQEKLKIYNELTDKKNNILPDIDGNIDEYVKINENKLNYGNNEIGGIEENKKKIGGLNRIYERKKIGRNRRFKKSYKRIGRTN